MLNINEVAHEEFQELLNSCEKVEFCGKGRIIYIAKNGKLYANGRLKNIDKWKSLRLSMMVELLERSLESCELA